MLHSLSPCRLALHQIARFSRLQTRQLSTLKSNPHIHVHTLTPTTHVLSYLKTSPPRTSLAIGTVNSANPNPTPDTLEPNPSFLPILQSVLHQHAASDPNVQASATAYASAALASTGVLSPGNASSQRRRSKNPNTQVQRGGWVHVSDSRNPPDWARVAWPEDIFGSLEIDGQGRFVEPERQGETRGRYQDSGTYRIVTREGILGLSPFLREKLVERLCEMEEKGL